MAGRRIKLREFEVVVDAVSSDGSMREASFRFERPLEDAAYRFVLWRAGAYHPAELPPLGGAMRLPPTLR